MKLTTVLLLVITSAISLSFSFYENPPIKSVDRPTFKDAVDATNNNIGPDSIYLSSINLEYQPDQFMISDHLVLVNDLHLHTDLLSGAIQFSVSGSGHLELVDFNLKDLKSRIINNGSISLKNCLFEEGKNLAKMINNKGAFTIINGKFEGSSEGVIYRDAVFSHAARIIL